MQEYLHDIWEALLNLCKVHTPVLSILANNIIMYAGMNSYIIGV